MNRKAANDKRLTRSGSQSKLGLRSSHAILAKRESEGTSLRRKPLLEELFAPLFGIFAEDVEAGLLAG